MTEKDDRNKKRSGDNLDEQPSTLEDFGDSTTLEMSREMFTGEIPVIQSAHFEVISADGKNEIIELGEEEITIGRSPKCEIFLPLNNVSRRHARVVFRNEEYHIEDLNSTNGVYVNGIRVEKCVLRNNDQIVIGGLKIFFYEEKALRKA